MKVTHLYPVQHGSTPASKIKVPRPVVSGRNAEKEGQEGNVEEGRKEEGLMGCLRAFPAWAPERFARGSYKAVRERAPPEAFT